MSTFVGTFLGYAEVDLGRGKRGRETLFLDDELFQIGQGQVVAGKVDRLPRERGPHLEVDHRRHLSKPDSTLATRPPSLRPRPPGPKTNHAGNPPLPSNHPPPFPAPPRDSEAPNSACPASPSPRVSTCYQRRERSDPIDQRGLAIGRRFPLLTISDGRAQMAFPTHFPSRRCDFQKSSSKSNRRSTSDISACCFRLWRLQQGNTPPRQLTLGELSPKCWKGEERTSRMQFADNCKEVVELARNDSSKIDWVTFKYATKSKLEVNQQGSGG
jgi:hypothetical protein